MSRARIAIVGALSALVLAPSAADAQYWGGRDGYRQIDRRDYDGYGRYDDRGDRRAYPRGGYGYGNDYRRGRQRYRCDRGTGGTIIGAIAGGLLGNTVAGRGDRGVGTIVGAGVGALAGRAIDRNC